MGADGSTRPSLTRGGAILATSTVLGNALGYALTVALARSFTPAEYGALGALLGIGLIGLIPSGALHYAVARRTAARGLPAGLNERSELVFAGRVGLVLALAGVACAPVTAAFLHLGSIWPAVWLGATMLPFSLQGALRGTLLGHERYLAYGVGDVLTAALRFGAGVVAGLAGLTVTGAVLALAVANVVAVAALLWLTGVRSWRLTEPASIRDQLADVVRSCSVIAGIVVLSNVDLLLARHYLDAELSGSYALASLFAKACLFGAQFAPTLVFPRMSQDGDHSRLSIRAAAVVAAFGGGCILLSAVAAEPIVALVAGSANSYPEVVQLAAPFAVLGTVWALVQLALLSAVAAGDPVPGRLLWVVVAAETAAIAVISPRTPAQVLVPALVAATTLGVACAVLDLRRNRSRRARFALAQPVAAGQGPGV